MTTTTIVGAGIAGLTAARQLRAAGHTVQVLDKGRGVGGRLATRRIGSARLDHGAQFFTTRGAAFTNLIADAVQAGVAEQWCLGFGEPDGFPRYCGADGMTSLAKWLATDLDVRLGVEVHAIDATDGTVQILDKSKNLLSEADQVVVTTPIPQMLQIFDRGNVQIPTDLDESLRAVRYFATLALLAVVEGQTAIDEPGGIQLDDGPFTFIADNHRKGISPVSALTLHAEHDYSLRRYDDPDDEILAELIERAAPWIGDAEVVEAQLKKWRYAGPVTPLPDPTYVFEAARAHIALAGDAFAGPKVEGAFNSGLAAAAALLQVR